MITAYAITWPHCPDVLLFRTLEAAEENRRWFAANHKRNSNGESLGEPRIIELVERHSN